MQRYYSVEYVWTKFGGNLDTPGKLKPEFIKIANSIATNNEFNIP